MRNGSRASAVVTLLAVLLASCARAKPDTTRAHAILDAGTSSGVGATTPGGEARPASVAKPNAERSIPFAWKPEHAADNEYSMQDPLDQHRVWLPAGWQVGASYPVVVALHGQPRRNQAPRTYKFVSTVADSARELIATKATAPFILVTPIFRFQGQNWPHFDLVAFLKEVRTILRKHQIDVSGLYVFGHSGAAGCGGQGLNQAAALSPAAVGFFDTCVGLGFTQAVKQLTKHSVPTFIAHSVETAGFQPRQPVEYDANFDFGKVYASIPLRPCDCPSRLPTVPLLNLAYRCAKSEAGTTRALVFDTGTGEKAHEALVPVAMRYFLEEYLPR
jgi:hypothetical protein